MPALIGPSNVRAAIIAAALYGVSMPAHGDIRDWLQRHIPSYGGGKPEAFRSALADPTAKLFAFFQPLGLLPVLEPAGKTPGDVYRSTLGGFKTRQPTCFPKLAEVRGSANLPSMAEAGESELSASLKAAIAEVSLGEGGVKLRFERSGRLNYGNVSFLSTGEAEVIKSFEATKTKPECAPLSPLLDGKANSSGAEGLILGNVYSATIAADWKISADNSGQVKLSADEVAKLIKKAAERLFNRNIPVNIDIGAEIGGSHGLAREVSLVSSQPLPVAYTPLFISVQHLEQISRKSASIEILENVFIAERRANPSMTKGELRSVMSKEANLSIPSVESISRAMQTGPFAPFDPENPEHASYIAAIDTLLALSLEVSDS
ncbi:hypothetical protein [Methylocapsa acidiphila]|uniref:hypothetical protein n=1 Tax=Methylocapsa acidiphila TaxID=133552 RepID=UPI00047DDEA0|nr:hypothetical protein [Methylocapsa acidiphila]